VSGAEGRAILGGTMRSLAFAALAFGVWSAGCSSDRACFTWGEHEGACPSREDAKDFMNSPGACGERVVSVDSDAEEDVDEKLDKKICCYDVTKDDPGYCANGNLE
jgi:hypothetical protein